MFVGFNLLMSCELLTEFINASVIVPFTFHYTKLDKRMEIGFSIENCVMNSLKCIQFVIRW